ncbi:MAG: NADH-quinone oxidoreductase subunit C [Candidatus Aenigmatarchaeota archaeon]
MEIRIKEIKNEEFKIEMEKMKDRRLIAIVGVDEGKDLSVYYIFDGENDVDSIKIKVPEKKPKIPTIIFNFPSAELYEREVHDFFGIEFEGNPNLHEKLFLPQDYRGKPPLLRRGD